MKSIQKGFEKDLKVERKDQGIYNELWEVRGVSMFMTASVRLAWSPGN